VTAVPVHYRIDGADSGELVVLSGSLGSDLRMWDPQIGALTAAGYRVVRYDHRGHGDSPVPPGPYTLAALGADVVELLDGLNEPTTHFVGLSLGGMVGMWLAQHFSQRLKSLTLCCTSSELGPSSGWAERAAAVRANGTPVVSKAVVERWFTPGWRAANADRVRDFEAMVAATPAEGYASCCEAIQTMHVVHGLPGSAHPLSSSPGPTTRRHHPSIRGVSRLPFPRRA
jgi:3-oxoadipate enol-lactonase